MRYKLGGSASFEKLQLEELPNKSPLYVCYRVVCYIMSVTCLVIVLITRHPSTSISQRLSCLAALPIFVCFLTVLTQSCQLINSVLVAVSAHKGKYPRVPSCCLSVQTALESGAVSMTLCSLFMTTLYINPSPDDVPMWTICIVPVLLVFSDMIISSSYKRVRLLYSCVIFLIYLLVSFGGYRISEASKNNNSDGVEISSSEERADSNSVCSAMFPHWGQVSRAAVETATAAAGVFLLHVLLISMGHVHRRCQTAYVREKEGHGIKTLNNNLIHTTPL